MGPFLSRDLSTVDHNPIPSHGPPMDLGDVILTLTVIMIAAGITAYG
jgi:hypothetical protein